MSAEILSQGENLLPHGLDASKLYVVASNPPWFEGEECNVLVEHIKNQMSLKIFRFYVNRLIELQMVCS